MAILVIGLSHHTSPVELRERFAFSDAQIPEALGRLRSQGVAEEAVILSTCNRVEIYVAASNADRMALRQFLLDSRGGPQPLGDEIYTLSEPQSIEHLFKVACGLDSMVLGETEILGQLKKAYSLALETHHTGSRLNKAFQRACKKAEAMIKKITVIVMTLGKF